MEGYQPGHNFVLKGRFVYFVRCAVNSSVLFLSVHKDWPTADENLCEHYIVEREAIVKLQQQVLIAINWINFIFDHGSWDNWLLELEFGVKIPHELLFIHNREVFSLKLIFNVYFEISVKLQPLLSNVSLFFFFTCKFSFPNDELWVVEFFHLLQSFSHFFFIIWLIVIFAWRGPDLFKLQQAPSSFFLFILFFLLKLFTLWGKIVLSKWVLSKFFWLFSVYRSTWKLCAMVIWRQYL